MRTPMQELIDELKELQETQDPYTLQDAIEFAEATLEKERERMVGFAYKCRNLMAADEFAINHWYDKTFKTKEI